MNPFFRTKYCDNDRKFEPQVGVTLRVQSVTNDGYVRLSCDQANIVVFFGKCFTHNDFL